MPETYNQPEIRNSALFEALVAYYADPTDQRTLKDISAAAGLDESTVHEFKTRHARTIFRAVDACLTASIPRLRAAAFKTLFQRMGKSDAALRMALQVTQDLVERSEVQQTILTPQEKRERIAGLMSRVKIAKALPVAEQA